MDKLIIYDLISLFIKEKVDLFVLIRCLCYIYSSDIVEKNLLNS